MTGPNKFTSVRLKTLLSSMEKAPFLPINFIGKAWPGGGGGCIHERHLLLQEMYVTGVFSNYGAHIVMFVALHRVSVTFSLC